MAHLTKEVFKTLKKVWRKLTSGTAIKVGELAQNKQDVYFQYNINYLNKYENLSPFNLNFDSSLQLAPKKQHNGLHGAFSDSLPDGWGMLLMDRLAFVGKRAISTLL
mgnify:FL=1